MTKEWWLVGMVVMFHGILDTTALTLSHEHIVAAELLFIVVAAINWYVWRVRSKELAERPDDPTRGVAGPEVAPVE